MAVCILSIAAGSHALTGRIAAATDKDLPIATVTASLADGKFYSFYQSGFYNATAKTIDAFVIEDPVTAPADYSVASVRFVNAIANAAYPLNLYARATIGDTVTLTPIGSDLLRLALLYPSRSPPVTLCLFYHCVLRSQLTLLEK